MDNDATLSVVEGLFEGVGSERRPAARARSVDVHLAAAEDGAARES